MVLRLEVLVEHFSKQRPAYLQLVLLVLHGNAGGPMVLEDLSPRIEQVYDPVLDAAQTLLPFSFVGDRLLADALEEHIEELAFERGPNVGNLLHALWGFQPRLGVTGQADKRPRKAAIERLTPSAPSRLMKNEPSS